MADGKKPNDDERLARLEAGLATANKQIEWMQSRGGFTDAKTTSLRCARIEERVLLLELDTTMLTDVAAFSSSLLEDHLRDRHDCDVDRDSAIDASNWRKIRRRLRDWAEKRGLLTKRRDLSHVRQDENRLRPRAATS